MSNLPFVLFVDQGAWMGDGSAAPVMPEQRQMQKVVPKKMPLNLWNFLA
ncbi:MULTISPECIES: hypothetical protein [unclassified Rhizobium]|nr:MULTISPECIES: hypothetical protein [unclassified Rhizobium]